VSFAENKGERALPQRGVASTSSLRFYALTIVAVTVTAMTFVAPTMMGIRRRQAQSSSFMPT
jgi:hypothetical protein